MITSPSTRTDSTTPEEKPNMQAIMQDRYGFADVLDARQIERPVPGDGKVIVRFAEGDHVFGIGHGAFADYARASQDKLAAAPPNIELTVAMPSRSPPLWGQRSLVSQVATSSTSSGRSALTT